jgi:hypothetical protein
MERQTFKDSHRNIFHHQTANEKLSPIVMGNIKFKWDGGGSLILKASKRKK